MIDTDHEPDTVAAVETAECTCCKPPRPIHRDAPSPGNDTEWEHDVDAMFATVYHVHFRSESADCDGPHHAEHTYQLTSLVWERIFAADPERLEHGPDDSDLWCQLVRMEVPCHAEQATVTISTGLMTWNERTDEGYSGGQLVACTDPSCAHEGSRQRDIYAERSNY